MTSKLPSVGVNLFILKTLLCFALLVIIMVMIDEDDMGFLSRRLIRSGSFESNGHCLSMRSKGQHPLLQHLPYNDLMPWEVHLQKERERVNDVKVTVFLLRMDSNQETH